MKQGFVHNQIYSTYIVKVFMRNSRHNNGSNNRNNIKYVGYIMLNIDSEGNLTLTNSLTTDLNQEEITIRRQNVWPSEGSCILKSEVCI